jgi:hypothetical protein
MSGEKILEGYGRDLTRPRRIENWANEKRDDVNDISPATTVGPIMSAANNPTLLSEPEPERDQVQLGPRAPRVHFNDAVRFRHHPHAHPISANESASPQRFTNPFGRDELEPNNPTSYPALDGVTLYQTQLPFYGSSTLEDSRNQGDFHVQLPPTRDRFLWSSHQHPYDIEPPSRVYDDATFGPRRLTVGSLDPRGDSVGSGSVVSLPPRYSTQDPIDVSLPPMPRRFRGGFANMLELWRVYWQQAPDQSEFVMPGDALFGNGQSHQSRPWLVRSQSSFGYDPDDPKFTGMKKASQEDPEDAESQCRQQMNLQYMSYRQRRKEAQKIKIQFNVTCNFFLNSHDLLVLSLTRYFFLSLPSFQPFSTANNS